MTAEKETLPFEYLKVMSRALKALSHPQRLRILEYLDIHGEACAGDIIRALGLEQSAGSQYLAKMCAAGLLDVRQERTKRYFFITNEHAVTILDCMRNKRKNTVNLEKKFVPDGNPGKEIR